MPLGCNLSQNLRQYANNSVNYADVSLMKLTPGNLINIFSALFMSLEMYPVSKLKAMCQQQCKLCQKSFIY
jgi:hypothetical protein